MSLQAWRQKLALGISVVAVVIAVVAVREFLRPSTDSAGVSAGITGPLVGEIKSVEGEVMMKPPRGTRFELLKNNGPIPFQAESVLQTQATSAAVIEFRPGPTIRLLENSRLVAEIDTSRENSIQAVVLAGEVTVLDPGPQTAFTLLQNGAVVSFRNGETDSRRIPLIRLGATDTNATANASADLEEKLETEKESELATAPTVDLENLAASAPSSGTKAGSTEKPSVADMARATLTNDDIRTQVHAQAGSFQKCYVTMVNRMSESGSRAGSLPRGETRVGFKILPSGKVQEPRVLKSPFRDDLFERCMADALGRLRFRPFAGAAIPVGEFPILLE